MRRDRCSVSGMGNGADSACNRKVQIEPEKLERIEARIDALRQYLLQECPECFTEQRHTREHSQERIYWHYGYFVALRDVLKLITRRNEGSDNSFPLDMPDESRYSVD